MFAVLTHTAVVFAALTLHDTGACGRASALLWAAQGRSCGAGQDNWQGGRETRAATPAFGAGKGPCKLWRVGLVGRAFPSEACTHSIPSKGTPPPQRGSHVTSASGETQEGIIIDSSITAQHMLLSSQRMLCTMQAPASAIPHPNAFCSPLPSPLNCPAPPLRWRVLLPQVSHGAGLGYTAEFLWQGTADVSAWLAVPAALAVMRTLGRQGLWKRNAALVMEAAAMLSAAWGGTATLGGDGTSSMAAVALPARIAGPAGAVISSAGDGAGLEGLGSEEGLVPDRLAGQHQQEQQERAVQLLPPNSDSALVLHHWLRYHHRIEVPVVCVAERLWVRISCQAYNEIADYKHLADAVSTLVAAAGAAAAAAGAPTTGSPHQADAA